MQKAVDIAFYDLIHHFRSIFAIGMMFFAPLTITGLIYFAFSGGSSASIQPINITVANLDKPSNGKESLAQSLIDIMQESSLSDLLKTSQSSNENIARQMVDAQQAGVAIVIPENFTKNVNHGRNNTPIKIIQDPTLSIGPAVVKNMVEMYLDGINGFRIMAELVSDGLQRSPRAISPTAIFDAVDDYKEWFEEYQDELFHGSDYLNVNLPSASEAGPGDNGKEEDGNNMNQVLGLTLAGQMLFFSFYTGAYSMMSILRDQEQGTLARLFTTPTPRSIILTGKFLAVFMMVSVQAIVLLCAGALAFHVNWGQPLSILMMVIAQVIAAGGLGVLLISFVKNSKQAGPVLGGGLSTLGMLGGLFTSSVSMPEIMTRLAVFTPQGWAINGWKLVLGGASVAELVPTCLVLILLGVIMFGAGAFVFQRRFA
ncbi:MAG: ABC transporter permease [Anaerolineae bacterium]|nr:ABC transporter permease [Anaerolineae bacterium]